MVEKDTNSGVVDLQTVFFQGLDCMARASEKEIRHVCYIPRNCAIQAYWKYEMYKLVDEEEK